MVDYAVFISNGVTLQHIGDINNVKSFQEAKNMLLRTPRNTKRKFFLVNKSHFLEVDA